MHEPWLVHYRAEIDTGQFASLKDAQAAGCTRFADLPAYNADALRRGGRE